MNVNLKFQEQVLDFAKQTSNSQPILSHTEIFLTVSMFLWGL